MISADEVRADQALDRALRREWLELQRVRSSRLANAPRATRLSAFLVIGALMASIVGIVLVGQRNMSAVSGLGGFALGVFASVMLVAVHGAQGRHVSLWSFAKRSIDVAISALSLVTLTPLLLLVAIALKIERPGLPVLFRSIRIGRNGRPFYILKFRTVDMFRATPGDSSSDRPAPVERMADVSVTHVGRFVRASSLDELPQLWNILKGEMSLVGPLPRRPSDLLVGFGHISRAKPGITGLWLISPPRSVYEMERLDDLYERTSSLRLDLRILASTVPAVLKQPPRD